MDNSEKLKNLVKEKYADIVVKSDKTCCCSKSTNQNSCCDPDDEFSILTRDYDGIDGYYPEADLNLGCGVPTKYAGIQEGDIVVDLGSGAGNDVFIARRIVGENGYVIGIDMTREMINAAIRNQLKLGYANVEFRLGEIENLPLDDDSTDVVISNCVLNLVPDKRRAFSEIYRSLKPGGHFCISDIVINGNMSEDLKVIAEIYAGCISGALDEREYLSIIYASGFENVAIKQKIETAIPDELLLQYISKDRLNEVHNEVKGIYSITVVGYKN
ncbi:MAG TPA: arsenite methyltransferase [Caldithrix sp.]|nr:arsenite methyltransferase [Caldithrix sp.]